MLTYRMFTIPELSKTSKNDDTKNLTRIVREINLILPIDPKRLDDPIDLEESLLLGYLLANHVLNPQNRFSKKIQNTIHALLNKIVLSVANDNTFNIRQNPHGRFLINVFNLRQFVFTDKAAYLFWVAYCYEKDNLTKTTILNEAKKILHLL